MQSIVSTILLFLQNNILALGILLPLLIAVLIFVFARHRAKVAITFSILAILLSISLIFFRGLELIPFVPSSPSFVLETFLWIPTLNIAFNFMVDGLNFPIILTTAIITIFIILYSRNYFSNGQQHGTYYASILFLFSGMVGVFAAADLFLFYLFWEITIIPAFFLLIFWREEDIPKVDARKTGMKFFLWTHVGSLILLMGIVLVVMLTGTNNIIDLPAAIAGVGMTSLHLLQFAAAAMIFGFIVKLGIFPVHSWLPDTYVQAGSPVTALIGGLLANIGAYGLIRLVIGLFPSIVVAWTIPLGVLGVISIIYGGYIALGQSDLKRRWAYSSISQGGYILLGVASISVLGIAGAALFIINSAILKSALFLTTGTYLMILKTTDTDSLRGMGTRMPITGITFLFAALGTAGIPPLNGFISEILIFFGIFTVSNAIIVAIIAALAIIWTFAYVLGPIYKLFVSPPEIEHHKAQDSKLWQTTPFTLLSLLILVLGIWPEIALTPIAHWLNSLTLGGP
ncbi:MAG: NuoM family protein [Promethearchaeota archaeon]